MAVPDGINRYAVGRNLSVVLLGGLFRGHCPHPQGDFLAQCNVNIVLGHRKRQHMRLLISPLKGIINAFLNG